MTTALCVSALTFVVGFVISLSWMTFHSKHKTNTQRARTRPYKNYDSLIDAVNQLRKSGYSIREAAIKIAPDYDWLAWKMINRVEKIQNIYHYQIKAKKNDALAKENS